MTTPEIASECAKDPGQVAYEAVGRRRTWRELSTESRRYWRRVEEVVAAFYVGGDGASFDEVFTSVSLAEREREDTLAFIERDIGFRVHGLVDGAELVRAIKSGEHVR